MQESSILNRPFVLPALVLGVCLIVGTGIVAMSVYAARVGNDTISTTGSATQSATSDNAKWVVSVYRTAEENSVPGTYAAVAADAKKVIAFLKAQGIADADITQSAIYADQDYSYSYNGGPKRYNVHQDITVQSSDVQKIAALSKDIGSLVAQGVLVSPQPPQYYISNLPELRVSLLGKAIQDAKARAGQLAQASGASVGKLRSASSGVVQVLTENSTDISDYGSYDTSTIEKQVMVTARATFSVK